MPFSTPDARNPAGPGPINLGVSHECASDPVGRDDPGFPAAVRASPSSPKALWVRGRLPAASERCVAVVGARAATRSGCALAADLAGALVRAGVAVVSGGAIGIDAAAHRGALAARGATFAVLGCGIDVVYPDRHARLFHEIAASGGVLTQFPPGTQPRSGHFPARNRIVAALSEAIVVVEARRSSGALITAGFGRALGRRLLAVPGTSGADDLVRSGVAAPVDGPAALRAALDGDVTDAPVAPPRFDGLLRILRAAGGSADAGAVARGLDIGVRHALALLAEAEIEGWIRRAAGGRWEAPRGH